MCDEVNKRSEFYKDEEKQKEACKVLERMKEVRERRESELRTIILPNGVRVSSTSGTRLKQYELYGKRKNGCRIKFD